MLQYYIMQKLSTKFLAIQRTLVRNEICATLRRTFEAAIDWFHPNFADKFNGNLSESQNFEDLFGENLRFIVNANPLAQYAVTPRLQRSRIRN